MASTAAKITSIVAGLIMSAVLVAGVVGFLLLCGVPMLFAAGVFAGAQGLITGAVIGASVRRWAELGND